MNKKRHIITETLQWQNVTLSVSYERRWASIEVAPAHLEIRVIAPEKAQIPITETGFRSHFVDDVAVADAGGAVAYVRAWLDAEATTLEWKRREEAARQLNLF